MIEEFGAADGVPCLYFHGTNSGPAEAALLGDAAQHRGVRLISVPRPEPVAQPTTEEHPLVAWGRRLGLTADKLGLGRFVVAGWSAGASLALACAHALPGRVSGAALINPAPPAGSSGLNRQQRAITFCCRHAPWLIRRVLAPLLARASGVAAEHLDDPRAQSRALALFPRADRGLLRAVLEDPVQRRMLGAMSAQSAAAGPGAIASDLLTVWGPRGWGFDPCGAVGPLHAFAGDQDASAPFVRMLARHSPQVCAHHFPGDHYGFLDEAVRDEICLAIRQQHDDSRPVAVPASTRRSGPPRPSRRRSVGQGWADLPHRVDRVHVPPSWAIRAAAAWAVIGSR